MSWEDVVPTSHRGSGLWFHIVPLLRRSGFSGGGPDTAGRATRGKSTAGKPPISQTLTLGISRQEKTHPP